MSVPFSFSYLSPKGPKNMGDLSNLRTLGNQMLPLLSQTNPEISDSRQDHKNNLLFRKIFIYLKKLIQIKHFMLLLDEMSKSSKRIASRTSMAISRSKKGTRVSIHRTNDASSIGHELMQAFHLRQYATYFTSLHALPFTNRYASASFSIFSHDSESKERKRNTL